MYIIYSVGYGYINIFDIKKIREYVMKKQKLISFKMCIFR